VPAEAHGGVNYAGYCQDGAEDRPGVCHIPEPGRPDRVWWLGFDCSHAHDATPTMDVRLLKVGIDMASLSSDLFPRIYRTIDYVRAEVAYLAGQVQAAAISASNSTGEPLTLPSQAKAE